MAGHSQFKNIMFRKGKQDKERSKLFAKLSREITVAAKSGLPDPAHNPRLRTAIIAAKAESMPKDNIERAIQKAAGNTGENYDEVRYEGRGPGGVALIVETMTDNRNRTSADVRAAFSKYGGAMGETGSVTFLFDHVGVIDYPAAKGSEGEKLTVVTPLVSLLTVGEVGEPFTLSVIELSTTVVALSVSLIVISNGLGWKLLT